MYLSLEPSAVIKIGLDGIHKQASQFNICNRIVTKETGKIHLECSSMVCEIFFALEFPFDKLYVNTVCAIA